MSEFFRHVSVVGKKENAGGVSVKTANRINSLRTFSGNKVHHSLAGVRIVCSGNAVLRLVHYDVNLFLPLEKLAFKADFVCLENLGPKLCNSLSINSYKPLNDIFVCLSAGADSGIGNEAVQADSLFQFCLWLARLWSIDLSLSLARRKNGFPSFQLASYLLKIAAGTLSSCLWIRESPLDGRRCPAGS